MAICRHSALKVLSTCKTNLLSSSFRSLPHRMFCSVPSIPSNLERVGFIGVGNMGFHMANNLINAGFQVTIHDKNSDAIKKFSDNGIPTKETPFEVAETSDVIVTMLPSSSNVLEVYTGTNGLLHRGKHLRPWLLIDSSTVDPHTSRMLSALVSKCFLKEKKGCWGCPAMLDAPVSGGVLGAEAGSLTFMAAKICNNLAMAVSMLGVSEAFSLGQSLGIKASTLTRIFNSSSARCWSSDSYNPVPGVMEGVPSSRNYDGGFSAKLMELVSGRAIGSARESGGLFVFEDGTDSRIQTQSQRFESCRRIS